MRAFEVVESGARVGVVFGESRIAAALRGAATFNEGELEGVAVERAPWADQYGSATKIPAALMVVRGIVQQCSYCRECVGDAAIGHQHGRIYCDDACRVSADRQRAKKAA